MESVQTYIEALELQLEVNRIVQGMAKRSGKPADHINSLWKATDKEVVGKHQYGVTDKQKLIGSIVRAKLGLKDEEDDKSGDSKEE